MKGTHQGKNNETKLLYKAILQLKTIDEADKFFTDLLTIEEATEMSKRWQAARLLNQEESYRAVAKKTGLSTTTVARVANWLKNGTGGYQLMLDRIKK